MLIGILDLRSFVWNVECWNCLAWKLQCWEWILQLKLLWLSSSCFSARFFSCCCYGSWTIKFLSQEAWRWGDWPCFGADQATKPGDPGIDTSCQCRNLYHLQIHLLQHLFQVPLQVLMTLQVLLQWSFQCPLQVPQRLPTRLLQATWEHAQFVGKKRIGEMGAAWIQPALQPGFQ